MFDLLVVFGRSQEVLLEISLTKHADGFIKQQIAQARRHAAEAGDYGCTEFSAHDILSVILSPFISQFSIMSDLKGLPVCSGISANLGNATENFAASTHPKHRSLFGGRLVVQHGRGGCYIVGVTFYRPCRKGKNARLKRQSSVEQITNMYRQQISCVQTALDAFLGAYWADTLGTLAQFESKSLKLLLAEVMTAFSAEENRHVDWTFLCDGFEKLRLDISMQKVLTTIVASGILKPDVARLTGRTFSVLSLDGPVGRLELALVLAPASGYILNRIIVPDNVLRVEPRLVRLITNISRILFLRPSGDKIRSKLAPWISQVNVQQWQNEEMSEVEYYVGNLMPPQSDSQAGDRLFRVHFMRLFAEENNPLCPIVLVAVDRVVESWSLQSIIRSNSALRKTNAEHELANDRRPVGQYTLLGLVHRIIVRLLSAAETDEAWSQQSPLRMRQYLLQVCSLMDQLKKVGELQSVLRSLPSERTLCALRESIKQTVNNKNATWNSLAPRVVSFAQQLKRFYTTWLLKSVGMVDRSIVIRLCTVVANLNDQLVNHAMFIMAKAGFRIQMSDLGAHKYQGLLQIIFYDRKTKQLLAPAPADTEEEAKAIRKWQAQLFELKFIANHFNLSYLAIVDEDYTYTYNRWTPNRKDRLFGIGASDFTDFEDSHAAGSRSRSDSVNVPTSHGQNELMTIHASSTPLSEVTRQVARLLKRHCDSVSQLSTSGFG